ncbi:UNVERIFIED_CONTAM: hypothetical protein K2H54_055052 [Gekko kuhli]
MVKRGWDREERAGGKVLLKVWIYIGENANDVTHGPSPTVATALAMASIVEIGQELNQYSMCCQWSHRGDTGVKAEEASFGTKRLEEDSPTSDANFGR